jgi:hypothetical protein
VVGRWKEGPSREDMGGVECKGLQDGEEEWCRRRQMWWTRLIISLIKAV